MSSALLTELAVATQVVRGAFLPIPHSHGHVLFRPLGASNVSSNPNWHPDHKFNCGPAKTETNGFMIQTTARRYSIDVAYQGSESDMTAHTVCLRIHSRPFLFIGSQGH